MAATVRASVLRSLILDTVIAQEAAAQGLAATDTQVQSEVATEAAQAGGMSQLQSELAGAGGSIAQLRDEIRSQMNEQGLEDHFAQGRAATVEQVLGGGAAFAQTAKQYSDDAGTNSKGGDLGSVTTVPATAPNATVATAFNSRVTDNLVRLGVNYKFDPNTIWSYD